MFKKFFILILCLFCFIFSAAHADDAFLQKYDEAKQAYFEKDYLKAEKIFLELANQNISHADLFYNLGNVYFKTNQWGRSIQYYEKAKSMMPRDADLKVNLALAQQKITDKAEKSLSEYLVHTFYFWGSWIALAEYQLVLVFVSVLFWGFCLFVLLRHRGVLTSKNMILFLILVYLMGGYFLKNHLEAAGSYGIIIKPEVDVRASYMDNDKPLFLLHDGTKVRVMDSQSFGQDQQWLKITLPQGQRGWVLANEVGII